MTSLLPKSLTIQPPFIFEYAYIIMEKPKKININRKKFGKTVDTSV